MRAKRLIERGIPRGMRVLHSLREENQGALLMAIVQTIIARMRFVSAKTVNDQLVVRRPHLTI